MRLQLSATVHGGQLVHDRNNKNKFKVAKVMVNTLAINKFNTIKASLGNIDYIQ